MNQADAYIPVQYGVAAFVRVLPGMLSRKTLLICVSSNLASVGRAFYNLGWLTGSWLLLRWIVFFILEFVVVLLCISLV